MHIPNPTGKGGFGDNPQNQSGGRWGSDTSISHWYNKLLRMPIEEFKKFKPETKAQEIALSNIKVATEDLNYSKEVTDRTEGKAKQALDIKTDVKVDTIDMSEWQ